MELEEITWRNMAFRRVLIDALQEEIKKACIQIYNTAEEIEAACYKHNLTLKQYLAHMAQIVIRIRGVNKRVMLLKGEKLIEEKQHEVALYLQRILYKAIYKELHKLIFKEDDC